MMEVLDRRIVLSAKAFLQLVQEMGLKQMTDISLLKIRPKDPVFTRWFKQVQFLIGQKMTMC